MIIEVVRWKGAKKSHVVNQDAPTYTLCGFWIPQYAEKDEDYANAFPDCLRCQDSVMKS